MKKILTGALFALLLWPTSPAWAQRFLRVSTAANINSCVMLDSVDGDTEETGLTIAQADVRLSKNLAAYAQKNDASPASHKEHGVYSVPLNATDTGTLGPLDVIIHKSGALACEQHFVVLPANIYDSFVMGTDVLDVSLIQWLGSAPNALVSSRVDASVGAIAANAITATSINTDAITAAKVASDVAPEIQAGLRTTQNGVAYPGIHVVFQTAAFVPVTGATGSCQFYTGTAASGSPVGTTEIGGGLYYVNATLAHMSSNNVAMVCASTGGSAASTGFIYLFQTQH